PAARPGRNANPLAGAAPQAPADDKGESHHGPRHHRHLNRHCQAKAGRQSQERRAESRKACSCEEGPGQKDHEGEELMLIPKRVKYRKMHRGRRTGIATRGATVAFGDYGLQAVEACWMSNRQIEAARRAMTRHVKRGGQIWIRVFPDKSITKKPAETRMGSGKGNPEGWVAVVKPGRILFEMGGVTPQVAKEAMKLAASKLPIKTRFVSSESVTTGGAG